MQIWWATIIYVTLCRQADMSFFQSFGISVRCAVPMCQYIGYAIKESTVQRYYINIISSSPQGKLLPTLQYAVFPNVRQQRSPCMVNTSGMRQTSLLCSADLQILWSGILHENYYIHAVMGLLYSFGCTIRFGVPMCRHLVNRAYVSGKAARAWANIIHGNYRLNTYMPFYRLFGSVRRAATMC